MGSFRTNDCRSSSPWPAGHHRGRAFATRQGWSPTEPWNDRRFAGGQFIVAAVGMTGDPDEGVGQDRTRLEGRALLAGRSKANCPKSAHGGRGHGAGARRIFGRALGRPKSSSLPCNIERVTARALSAAARTGAHATPGATPLHGFSGTSYGRRSMSAPARKPMNSRPQRAWPRWRRRTRAPVSLVPAGGLLFLDRASTVVADGWDRREPHGWVTTLCSSSRCRDQWASGTCETASARTGAIRRVRCPCRPPRRW